MQQQERQEVYDLMDKTADEDRAEKAREFNLSHSLAEKQYALEKKKVELTKQKNIKDAELKEKQINKQSRTSTK